MERAGWADALSEFDPDSLRADFVKVSHHGSATGYSDGLWTAYSRENKPVAALTPYRSSHLPSTEGLRHICPNVRRLSTTCPDIPSFRLSQAVTTTTAWKSFRQTQNRSFGKCTFEFNDEGRLIAQDLSGTATDIILESYVSA